tara:strand:- start:323 stop:1975 length:1653 start_codon:yes stop_codon:yes gene_type:complete
MGNVIVSNITRTPFDNGSNWGSVAAPVAPVTDFQLPAANYVSSKLTMEVNSPRPDVERTTNSRYSFMHSGMENAMPIVVLGGAYPYKYEITSRSGTADTSTATIGETRTYGTDRSWYGSANQKDYGIFRWTPTGDDGLTYDFTVTVTGQDGISIAVPFSGVVQDSKFIFVDPDGGLDTNSGTLAAPFKTNLHWYIAATDATYADKFVVWRAGLQTDIGGGRLAGTYKPHVYIAFEGDAQPTYDGTIRDHHFQADESSPDFFWAGIRINGSRSDVAESRYFEVYGGSGLDRAVFWNTYFYDAQGGTVGTDNEGWISFRSGGTREYLSVVGNTFDTAPISANDNGFDSVRMYEVSKVVIEHNIIKNFTGSTLLQPKDSCYNLSFRANDMWEGNNPSKGIPITNQAGGNNHEICWNWVLAKNTLSVDGYDTNNVSAEIVNFFAYRNTLSSIAGAGRTPLRLQGDATTPFTGLVEVEGNVLMSDDGGLIAIIAESTVVAGSPFDDAGAQALFTGSTFDNTMYDLDTQTEVNMTTGRLQNGGLAVLGTDGAEVSA